MKHMRSEKPNASKNPIKNIFLFEGRLRPCILPLVAILCLLTFSITGISTMATAFTYNHQEIGINPEDIGIVEMDRPEGVTNIALFGIDARNDSFRGLSDSIMIISIDANYNSIKLISIMRDSLVRVDGHGCQKINAAYNLGGPQLAVKTLNQNFNMDISEYATVDFVSMAGIIDVVGGIEAELTEKEVANANKQIREMAKQRGTERDLIEQAGKQTLSGIQAVAFARIRKTATVNGTNDDYGRTERQRHVMHELFQKALDTDLAKYPAMIKALLPHMETSLTYAEIFKLAGILAGDGLSFQQARIPTNGTIIDGGFSPAGLGSCVYYDLSYAADLLYAFIYDNIPFEDYMEQNRVRYNRWFGGSYSSSEEENEQEDPEVTDPNAVVPGETDPNATVPGTTDPNASVTDPNLADPNTPGATDPNAGTTPPGTTVPNGGTTPDGSGTPSNGTDPNGGGTTPGGTPNDGGTTPGGNTTPDANNPDGDTTNPGGGTTPPGGSDSGSGTTPPGTDNPSSGTDSGNTTPGGATPDSENPGQTNPSAPGQTDPSAPSNPNPSTPSNPSVPVTPNSPSTGV